MAPGWRRAGNLPTELTSFLGRRDELAEVRRLLAGSHLVMLTGVGGVGKTRLALRAAAGLARAFPHGVWLVRLDQLREEALVAQAVAGTLGLQERAGYSPAAWLEEYLAGRRLLLVLDNCEHLIARRPSWPTSCCAPPRTCVCWLPAGKRSTSTGRWCCRCRRWRHRSRASG